LFLGHVNHFHSDNLETCVLKAFDHFADEPLCYSVRFNDRQRSLLHEVHLSSIFFYYECTHVPRRALSNMFPDLSGESFAQLLLAHSYELFDPARGGTRSLNPKNLAQGTQTA
jgi:hypothetical protein